jgi:hypothetical protein
LLPSKRARPDGVTFTMHRPLASSFMTTPLIRFFPDRELRAGRAPGIHHFFIAPLALRHPLRKIEDQGSTTLSAIDFFPARCPSLSLLSTIAVVFPPVGPCPALRCESLQNILTGEGAMRKLDKCTLTGRYSLPKPTIFQPTFQPTNLDVLYGLRVFWQSPRSCKLL